MNKPKHPKFVKPKIETDRWLRLTDFLIRQNEDKEMYDLGKTFRKSYYENLEQSSTNNVVYEESNSTGSPESYNDDDCKSGVCD